MNDKATQNQINKNKGRDNTLRLKNEEDILELLATVKLSEISRI